jgi:hypothetical protein
MLILSVYYIYMNSVLNNIIDIASNVKILGVGEASHGQHKINTFRFTSKISNDYL